MAKKKKAKATDGDEDSSKYPPGLYTLQRNREQEFRQTINYESCVSAQLVFQHGVDLDLTQEEVDQLEGFIDAGWVVPTNRDEKGRQRVVREVTPEATATIDKLEKRVEELATENATLRSELEAATAPK